jgi:hypothetical protein
MAGRADPLVPSTRELPMPDSPPTVGLLAGQLGFLFEEQPELRRASDEELAARLNHDDRWARARSTYPLATDAEVAEHLPEFDDRITSEVVHQARGRAGA